MNFDFSKFKKVASDKKTTTMQHPDGHKIIISHNSLSPKVRAQLTAIKVDEAPAKAKKFAEGGEVKKDSEATEKEKYDKDGKPKQDNTPEKGSKMDRGFTSIRNAFAKGGQVKDEEANAESPLVKAEREASEAINPPTNQPIRSQPLIDAEASLPPTPRETAPQLAAQAASPPQSIGSGFNAQGPMAGPTQSPNTGVMTQAPAEAQSNAGASLNQTSPLQPTNTAASEFGMDAIQMGNQAFEHQKQGVIGEGAAIAKQAQLDQQTLQKDIQFKQEAFHHFTNDVKGLTDEANAFKSDIENSHINPANYWNDHSKLLTSIGIIAAGFNPTSRPNAAIEMLNKQQDMNLEAQKAEIGKKENLLSANLRQFGNMRDALEMTRIMQNDVVADQLKKNIANISDPLAKSRLMQTLGQIEQTRAGQIEQLGNMRALRQLTGVVEGGDPDKVGSALSIIRQVSPEKAKELESRYLPGVGTAQIPLDEKVRGEIIARSDLTKQIAHLEQFASTHSGDLSPTDIAYGGALARNVQDSYRRANGQGVFREAEKDFVEKSISANPTQFLNNIRSLPAYKAVYESNQNTLGNLYQKYGFKTGSNTPIPQAAPVIKK